MNNDPKVLWYGLGVDDPKTFLELQKDFETLEKKEFLTRQHQKIQLLEYQLV